MQVVTGNTAKRFFLALAAALTVLGTVQIATDHGTARPVHHVADTVQQPQVAATASPGDQPWH
ncbi:hypothetical protein ABH931_005327 [Streptacidiphilus sp. MAP12-33]|uniref:hypothetical protein n=1 Tax=Streptacidiphilus sp. MAP12-33 TaxID=3156266 RepID=UPI0035121191